MKVLLILALAALAVAGEGRTVSRSSVPEQQVEMMKSAFWEYVSKATTAADESLKQMKQSELGKEINSFLSQSSEAVVRFSDALRTQVFPLTQDLVHKFNRETRQMQKRLEKDLNTFSSKIKPFTDELTAKLQKQVEDLQKEATTFAKTMDAETFKSSLMEKVQTVSRDLQAQTGAYVDLRQKMEDSFGDFQRSLETMTQNFETEVNKKVQGFAPYGEEIRTKLDLEAENVKKQLETLWKSFTQMVQ